MNKDDKKMNNGQPLEDDMLESVSGGNGNGGIGGGADNGNGVTVSGGTVTSGGIIGYATGAVITNCSNSGSVAQPDAGGILGG